MFYLRPVREDMAEFSIPMEKLTETDKLLIAQAEALHPTQLHKIDELCAKAETDMAKQIINNIGSRIYREEEYRAGMI